MTNRKKQKKGTAAAEGTGAAPNAAPLPVVAEVPRGRMILLVCIAAIAVCVAYANHFHNTFHFDDAHTIQNNVYIRDLHNIPLFFKDGSTFSSLPTNQSWRPLVSTSLAVDYKLAHGLNPVWFHISTFFWFLVQLVLMFYLFKSVLDAALPNSANWYVALFTATLYGVHPAIAETVNYIIQRGDLYSTLAVVAGMVMYIRLPRLRKYGLYILPVIAGALAKPPAVVFGAVLFVYIFLFEENAEWPKFWTALWRSAPALAACAVLAELNIKMTPSSYVPTELPHVMYWATQPFVAMRYVRSMFLPLWLSADSDLNPFDGFLDGRAIVGTGVLRGAGGIGILVDAEARVPADFVWNFLVFYFAGTHFRVRAFGSRKRSQNVFAVCGAAAERDVGRVFTGVARDCAEAGAPQKYFARGADIDSMHFDCECVRNMETKRRVAHRSFAVA